MLDSMSLNKVTYEMADKLPFRSIVVSASQGGKGILIQNLVLKVYRGLLRKDIYCKSYRTHWRGL